MRGKQKFVFPNKCGLYAVYNLGMLPRVVVWQEDDRESLYQLLGLSVGKMVSFEGGEANVQDFRHWVNTTTEMLKGKLEYTGIVWDSHLLSWECQAVLLKPLEELGESNFILVTQGENLLAETILSRCVVENLGAKKVADKYWPRIIQAWKEGPASCIALSDELDQDEVLDLSEEVINKLRRSVREEVNPKRVEILSCAMNLAQEMRAKNLNVKLCFGEFLLKGWRLTKT